MQPGSFQLRPDAIRASGRWYHAGLPASYARFAIDLQSCNQHDPQSCVASLYCAVASPTSARPHKCGMTTKKKTLEDAIMINLSFRSALMGFGLLIAALSPQVHAQSSPKTVTLVVPFAAVARWPMIVLPDRRLTVRPS
jgi:hypothetical protein